MEVKMRDSYFDLVKAVAIFMVVFGHVTTASGCHSMIVSNFIVGCNMPLFFIMSGYFAHDTIVHTECKKLMRHLRSYVQPMISIGILLSCCSAMFGLIPIELKSVGMYSVKWFLFSPWFLWTLAGIYLISFFSYWLTRNFKISCTALLIAILILVFTPNIFKGLLHIPALRNMLPYFLVGMILKHLSFSPWQSHFYGGCGLALFLLVVVVEGDVSKNGMGFYWVDSSWRAVFASAHGLITFILRPVVGVIGAIGVMYGLRQVLTKFPKMSCCAIIGRYTICIYLLHFWIMELIIEAWPSLQFSWLNAFLLSVFLTTFCGGFAHLTMEYDRFIRGILWGR